MATAKKLPSGNWRVQASATVNGKKVVKSFTAADKRQAEFEAAQWQNEIFKVYNDPGSITLNTAIEQYIENRRGLLSPTTIATYERIKKNHFLNIQDRPLSKLSNNSIQFEVTAMAKNHSPKSVKCAYGLIAAAIKEATGETIHVKLPKSQKLVYTTPDQKTAQLILDAARGTDIELPVTLALRLGLRVSEICGLKWSAVYDDYIHIDNVIISYGTEKFEKLPKSAAGVRKIPISNDIKELIEKQPRIDEYVYHKDSKAIGAAFRRLLEKNNLPHCRFHDLRHAYASAMALLGIPERYAMAVGGWDTPTVLRNIYQQTFTDAEKEFAKKIDNYFAKTEDTEEN